MRTLLPSAVRHLALAAVALPMLVTGCALEASSDEEALDAAGRAEHWFWDPSANVINHDDWGL